MSKIDDTAKRCLHWFGYLGREESDALPDWRITMMAMWRSRSRKPRGVLRSLTPEGPRMAVAGPLVPATHVGYAIDEYEGHAALVLDSKEGAAAISGRLEPMFEGLTYAICYMGDREVAPMVAGLNANGEPVVIVAQTLIGGGLLQR